MWEVQASSGGASQARLAGGCLTKTIAKIMVLVKKQKMKHVGELEAMLIEHFILVDDTSWSL